MKCTRCGAEISAKTTICPGCGGQIFNDSKSQNNNKNKRKIIILISAIIFLCLVIVSFNLTKGNKPKLALDANIYDLKEIDLSDYTLVGMVQPELDVYGFGRTYEELTNDLNINPDFSINTEITVKSPYSDWQYNLRIVNGKIEIRETNTNATYTIKKIENAKSILTLPKNNEYEASQILILTNDGDFYYGLSVEGIGYYYDCNGKDKDDYLCDNNYNYQHALATIMQFETAFHKGGNEFCDSIGITNTSYNFEGLMIENNYFVLSFPNQAANYQVSLFRINRSYSDDKYIQKEVTIDVSMDKSLTISDDGKTYLKTNNSNEEINDGTDPIILVIEAPQNFYILDTREDLSLLSKDGNELFEDEAIEFVDVSMQLDDGTFMKNSFWNFDCIGYQKDGDHYNIILIDSYNVLLIENVKYNPTFDWMLEDNN